MSDVSIIIPCYNREAFVGEAIESALLQENSQVIVVDDGSTDDSVKVVEQFGERVTLLRQHNRGPSAARNFGLTKATSKFVHFLDSDDLLQPLALAKMRSKAANLKKGEILFGCAVPFMSEIGLSPTLQYGFDVPAGTILSVNELLGSTLPVWLVLFPRSYVEEVGGFDVDLWFGEDLELAVRLHLAGCRFVASDIECVAVRNHDEARLTSLGPSDGSRVIRLWETLISRADAAIAADRLAARALGTQIWISGRDRVRAGDRATAAQLFSLARRVNGGGVPVRGLAGALARILGPIEAESLLTKLKKALRYKR